VVFWGGLVGFWLVVVVGVVERGVGFLLIVGWCGFVVLLVGGVAVWNTWLVWVGVLGVVLYRWCGRVGCGGRRRCGNWGELRSGL